MACSGISLPDLSLSGDGSRLHVGPARSWLGLYARLACRLVALQAVLHPGMPDTPVPASAPNCARREGRRRSVEQTAGLYRQHQHLSWTVGSQACPCTLLLYLSCFQRFHSDFMAWRVAVLALLAVAWAELTKLPEDCEDSECSLSLRQLRGEQTQAAMAADQAPDDGWGDMTQDDWEEKQGGLCCFSGDDANNVCGTCFPTAVASFKNSCSRKSQCGSCGGTWCEPKCVMGAADPNDKCGTAFETGTAKSDSFCGKSSKNCAACNGEWCKRGITKPAPKVVEDKATTVNAVSSASGFCCYRGDGLSKNMCGACADISQASACGSSVGCGKCGGTWCPGPRPGRNLAISTCSLLACENACEP